MKTPWQEEADQYGALCILGYLEDLSDNGLYSAGKERGMNENERLALVALNFRRPEGDCNPCGRNAAMKALLAKSHPKVQIAARGETQRKLSEVVENI